MLFQEARYLRSLLDRIPADQLDPMINLGSSTAVFRSEVQPWIDRQVFQPLRDRGVIVLHSDIKAAPGVDLVGDITDREFISRLGPSGFRAVICSNFLEHVEDPGQVCASIEQIVRSGGYVFVTVPRRYPLHPDPIDTGFRPAPMEVAALFPGCQLQESRVVDCGNYTERLKRGGMSVPKFVLSTLVPFYRPRRWWNQVKLSTWLLRRLEVTCVVLRRV
jgi:SAM-dependent methyltransferase